MANDPVVLTATMAAEWVSEEGPGLPADMAMDDIIHGRTVVVPVRTEAEAREAFVKSRNDLMKNVCYPNDLDIWNAALRYARVLPTGEAKS